MTTLIQCLSDNFTKWVVADDLLDSDFVVLDIGCQGGHCWRWDVLGPKLVLHGIDPLEEEIDRLVGANTNPNFHYHNLAIGDADEIRTFYVSGTTEQSSLIKTGDYAELARQRDTRNDIIGGERQVTVRRLDTLLAEGLFPRPDYIKMDVEGYEPRVIDGGRSLFSDDQVLAVESESGFTANKREPHCHFELISPRLHELGFYFYDLGNNFRSTKKSLSHGRLRAEFGGQISKDGFFLIGRLQITDALFCRDFVRDGATLEEAAAPEGALSDRLLKMCIIFELFNLNDCAIELLQFAQQNESIEAQLKFDVSEAIDRLTPDIRMPDITGRRIDYATYQRIGRALAEGRQVQVDPNNLDRIIFED